MLGREVAAPDFHLLPTSLPSASVVGSAQLTKCVKQNRRSHHPRSLRLTAALCQLQQLPALASQGGCDKEDVRKRILITGIFTRGEE